MLTLVQQLSQTQEQRRKGLTPLSVQRSTSLGSNSSSPSTPGGAEVARIFASKREMRSRASAVGSKLAALGEVKSPSAATALP